MKEKAKKIIRYIVAFISILVIIYMWSDIDISNYSKDDAILLIITNFAVSLVKAIIIFITIIFIKKIIKK